MTDCFISYTKQDTRLAEYVRTSLQAHGLSVFLAPISIRVGADWTEAVRTAMESSKWVIFLASRAACSSSYVQQEVGGAHFGRKTLIPLVWDMAPEELPGWAKNSNALDARGISQAEFGKRIQDIATQIKASKTKGFLIGAAIIGGLFWLSTQKV